MLLAGVASVWSAVTRAEFVTMVALCGVTTMLIVAVAALAMVPSWQITVLAACEHVAAVVTTETNLRTAGSTSNTVTLVALAGTLLVTISVYVSRFPCATGLGAAVLVMATSALAPVPTVTFAVALLLGKF